MTLENIPNTVDPEILATLRTKCQRSIRLMSRQYPQIDSPEAFKDVMERWDRIIKLSDYLQSKLAGGGLSKRLIDHFYRSCLLLCIDYNLDESLRMLGYSVVQHRRLCQIWQNQRQFTIVN